MTSTDISPFTQFHVEPVNGQASCNKSCDGSSSSSRTVTYDDLVRSSELFWEKLRALLGFTTKTLKAPTIAGNTLDLHRLFIEVTSRGGIEQVIKDRKLKEVRDAFNFPATTTNGSFVLRKYYLKFLYQLEHVYYFQTPVPSIQSTDEAMKSLANISPTIEEGIDERHALQGLIDGKFDGGYLVTVKMGSQELKGVLYHTPQTPSQPQQTVETSPAVVPPPSSQHMHRKRSRLALVDSQKPKNPWTGKHFFFAEHYARLKPEYQGQELAKMVRHMWSNLTDAEKQVYLDKGNKDLERYKRELLEYNSSHESGAAASYAAATVTQ